MGSLVGAGHCSCRIPSHVTQKVARGLPPYSIHAKEGQFTPFHDEMEYALVVPLEYRCVCCALYTRQACFL